MEFVLDCFLVFVPGCEMANMWHSYQPNLFVKPSKEENWMVSVARGAVQG